MGALCAVGALSVMGVIGSRLRLVLERQTSVVHRYQAVAGAARRLQREGARHV